jgi:hypothetical protein
MKPLNRMFRLISVGIGVLVFSATLLSPLNASSQFTKETGKKCADCHSKVPKKGDKDLYLTELGKKFKENGNKLPEEKK